MNKFFIKHLSYIKLIITIVIAYIVISLIDNIPFIYGIWDRATSILLPFIYGSVIAYVLSPLAKLIENKLKLNRVMSITLTYLLIVAFIAIGVVYVLPTLYYSVEDAIISIPNTASEVQSWLNDLMENPSVSQVIDAGVVKVDSNYIITTVSNLLFTAFNGLASTAFSVTSHLISFVFGFLVSIYILFDKERIIFFIKKIMYIFLKEKKTNILCEVARNIHKLVGTYIGIKAIDSLIIAIMAYIGISIIGTKYALLLAVIVGFTNMIPYFGPFIGIVVGFVMNIFTSTSIAILIAGFLFLLQQFDAWYLDPKLVGDKVGLPPFLVIFAVTVGGALYGIIGMVLSAPIMAVIKIYVTRFMDRYKFKELDEI